ncbi:MAG: D-alanyl-D-alanine carboxypeptidase, partial [Bacilli bacterium]|nr:D-alanyl-D-alanine carboxypeptidase [Bacilli bacterium]
KLVRFYEGVDGLKTGYTSTAGFCLTATAKKEGMRVIAVVMGEPDGDTRNKEIREMLDYMYAQYKVDILLEPTSVIETIKVEKSKEENVNIVPLRQITSFHKKLDAPKSTTYTLELNELKLPIKKGDVVGKLIIKEDKNQRTIDVTVSKDVNKANIIELFLRYLNDILTFDINW